VLVANAGISIRKPFLEIAESIGARYETALAAKALADVGADDDGELRRRGDALFTELGIVSAPEPPLP